MLKWWCSYCQKFQGETPPFGDLSITHVLCLECESAHSDVFAADVIRHGVFLREIFRSLFKAGRKNDFGSAERLVERAIAANCRPVDILIGIVAPMLYKIGEEWERAGEYSFPSNSHSCPLARKPSHLCADND